METSYAKSPTAIASRAADGFVDFTSASIITKSGSSRAYHGWYRSTGRFTRGDSVEKIIIKNGETVMGHYIQGPPKGKAQYIVSEYDAKYPDSENISLSFDARPKGYEWVCVVDNGPFEAAAWLFSEHEFSAFTESTPGDERPRKFLLVPAEKIKQIFPEQYDKNHKAD
jgi:hypothetical protein